LKLINYIKNRLLKNKYGDILTAEAARQHQRKDAEAPPGADDIKIKTVQGYFYIIRLFD